MTSMPYADEGILIVSRSDDAHARVIAHVLRTRMGLPSVIWDPSKLPASDVASFVIGDSQQGILLGPPRGPEPPVELGGFRSVWWRRPGRFAIPWEIDDPEVRRYCDRECASLLLGAFEAQGLPIVNQPTMQVSASRKPLQLGAARGVGLRVPQTLMSNDPERIKEFWARLKGRCVYKAFNSPAWKLIETRRLARTDLDDLTSLRFSPIIVQEVVDPAIDIRATVIGAEVFAAQVRRVKALDSMDWRVDPGATWDRHELPTEVAESLRLLTHRLGLHYGCADLRLCADGTYVFLEINPAGQFLFVEVDTGLPLSRAFADLLVEPRLPCGDLEVSR